MKPVVLITGVCGRIGSAAAKAFSKEFQVVGLDIFEPTDPVKEIDFIRTDISSMENVKDSLNQVREKYGNKIASCVHLAAYYNFEGGAWEKYEKITIGGTRNLIEGLESFELEQFVFSSTLLVYRPCKLGEKITEDSPVDAKWEYPRSKVETEKIVQEKNISSVILRISGIYDDECHSIPISQHIARIYEKKLESHFFPGNPHHGASFMHMDDLIQALLSILEKRKELHSKELFVLGEPKVLSFQDLQNDIGLLLHGKKWWTFRIPKFIAKIGAFLQHTLPFMKKSFIKPWMIDLADDHYDVDILKAKKVLNWEPMHVLKNCLPKIIQALQKDPVHWFKENGFAEKSKI